MSKIDPTKYGPNTRAVRAGQVRSAEGEHSELIFASSSYVFQNAAEAAARFKGEKRSSSSQRSAHCVRPRRCVPDRHGRHGYSARISWDRSWTYDLLYINVMPHRVSYVRGNTEWGVQPVSV